MSKSPLDGRPSLQTSRSHPLIRDLGKLRELHRLSGAVLISFCGDRVGVNSSGGTDLMGETMERLGDALLAGIDDGVFDDIARGLERPNRHPSDIAALLKEVAELPNPDRCLLTHNEAELIRFCRRLGDALRVHASIKPDGFEQATEGLMP